jgi:hypothetical protein
MNWKPPPDTDEEVRLWMKSKGWDVTGTEYDHERQTYTWRARSVRSGHSPAISISRQVLVDFPAFAILEHLHRLNVADAVRRRPDARYVVVQNGLTVTLLELL